jgi:hypothetical protein
MSEEPAWWYEDQGESIGPLVLEELKVVLSRRSNASETFVWRDGFLDWQRAGDVSALNGAMVNKIPVWPDISTLMNWRMGWVWLLLCLSVLLDGCTIRQRVNLVTHVPFWQWNFSTGTIVSDSPAIILVAVFLLGAIWMKIRRISIRSIAVSLAIGCIAKRYYYSTTADVLLLKMRQNSSGVIAPFPFRPACRPRPPLRQTKLGLQYGRCSIFGPDPNLPPVECSDVTLPPGADMVRARSVRSVGPFRPESAGLRRRPVAAGCVPRPAHGRRWWRDRRIAGASRASAGCGRTSPRSVRDHQCQFLALQLQWLIAKFVRPVLEVCKQRDTFCSHAPPPRRFIAARAICS